MILGGILSVFGSTMWYFVVVGQHGAVLEGTWYWVSFRAVVVCTGSVEDPYIYAYLLILSKV